MAITVPQWVKANSGSTATFANTTTGNTLVACVTYNSITVTVSTCKTTGNTFTKAVALPALAAAGGSAELWYIKGCTAETTPTVTLTWSGTAPTTITIDLFELHGANPVVYDQSTSGAHAATAITVTSMTPAQANSIVIACARCSGTMSTATFANTDLVTPAIRSEYTIQTTATAITSVGTDSTGATNNVAVVSAFNDVIPAQSITPAGIASTNAFGTATVGRGDVSIAPAGIASVNAFGTASVAFPGSTFNAGNTTQGGTTGTFTGITAVQFALATSGAIQSISIWWQNSGADTYGLGLYSDVSGAPNTLLASTSGATVTIGLQTLLTTTNPTLSPANYWLAVQNTGSPSAFFDTGGSGAFNNSAPWTGSMPGTFPLSGSGAYNFSLYATFTVVSGAQGITGTGIASTVAFGTATVAPGLVNLTPSGIPSTNAFGTATVARGTVSISPTGIASTNAFGTASLAATVGIAPSGIASVTTFGTATLLAIAGISPTGIPSVNAFGTAVVGAGAVNIAATGIASTTAFGTASLSPGTVNLAPSGIGSTNTFGTATVSLAGSPQSITATGIASTTAFGTATVGVVVSIFATGIASTTAFGTASIGRGTVNLGPSGIASSTAFGTATLTAGSVNLAPSGIASSIAFGTATVTRVTAIAPSGIASTTAFGTAAVARGAVNIAPSGIASSTAFGLPAIQQPSFQGIGATGIGSTTNFGTAHVIAIPKEQPVPPYAGDPQESEIDVPAWIRYREEQWEDGPWVMPPYAWIFPHPAPLAVPERGTDSVHAQWLATHPLPKGPRRMGDSNRRPPSLIPAHTRPAQIKPKYTAPSPRRMGDPLALPERRRK